MLAGFCVGTSSGQSDRRVGYGPLLRDYVYFLMAKLAFHRQHPEFNGNCELVSLQLNAAR